INIRPSLTSLKLEADSDKLAAYGSLGLSVSAKYRNIPVGVSFSQLNYLNTADTDIPEGATAAFRFGTLYDDGRLMASGNTDIYNINEEIIASFDGIGSSVSFTYGVTDTLIDDFEDISALFGGISQTNNQRYGGNSLVVVGKAEYTVPIKLLDGVIDLTVWMHNGADASVRIADTNGEIFDIAWEKDIVLGQKGWTRMKAVIPDEAVQPITIIAPVVCTSGVVTADDLRAGYGIKEQYFSDVDAGHWAYSYIDTVKEMGIIGGEKTDDGYRYRPDDALTRAEFARIITSYFGFHAAHSGHQNFLDENFPEWARSYAATAVTQRLMNGKIITENGIYFDPEAYITRAEVMQVFGSLIDCEAADVKAFSDSADIPDWAMTNVAKTVSSGIAAGYPDGTLRPTDSVTRSEIAVMFTRFDAFVY
nr:S-layer homology domain-containing protein [Clostridia bacterium]